MPNDEEPFVLLAAAGDDNAFCELVRLTQGRALAVAKRYLHNHTAAEDATQEAYVELYRALPRLREPGSFPAFFRKILLKHCDRHRRKHWREHPAEDPECAGADPPARPKLHELDDPWGGALAALTDEERQILLLRCTEGYTYAQLASLLNHSVHTITNRLNAARRKVRQHLSTMNEHDKPEIHPDPNLLERVIALIQPDSLASEERQGPGNCRGVDTWEMICAAIRGDVPAIRRLLKTDPNLAITEYWYTQPIHFAAREGHLKAVRTLIEAGADPHHLRDGGDDLVLTARDRGHKAVAGYLESVRRSRNLDIGTDLPIHQAAAEGDIEALRKELEREPSLVNAPDSEGNLPLHLTVASGNREAVEALLEAGAEIDAIQAGKANGAHGFRPVHSALWKSGFFFPGHRRGDWKMLDFLLSRGARYSAAIAAARGDLTTLKSIVAQDPGAIDAPESCGRRPLSCASEFGHAETVDWLLEMGANPNLTEGRYAPLGVALHAAASNGDERIVSRLLQHGTDPNSYIDSCGTTPSASKVPAIRRQIFLYGGRPDLFGLVWNDEVEMLAALAGHAPEVLKKYSAQLFTAAVKGDREDLFHWFLRIGLRVPKTLTFCRDYLWSRPRYTRILLEHGMDPNLPDWQRATPLHAICKGDRHGHPDPNRVELAKLFKEFGADLNAIDEEYRSTPLAWAARTNVPDMVQWLLDNGADPDLAAEPWAHPLEWARRRGHEEIVTILDEIS